MPEPTMVTEKEAVLRERRAFVAGASVGAGYHPGYAKERAPGWAAERYAMPKVARPRIAREPGTGIEFRVNERGYIETRAHTNTWKIDTGCSIDATRAALYADLFDNPTEEVPDDDA